MKAAGASFPLMDVCQYQDKCLIYLGIVESEQQDRGHPAWENSSRCKGGIVIEWVCETSLDLKSANCKMSFPFLFVKWGTERWFVIWRKAPLREMDLTSKAQCLTLSLRFLWSLRCLRWNWMISQTNHDSQVSSHPETFLSCVKCKGNCRLCIGLCRPDSFGWFLSLVCFFWLMAGHVVLSHGGIVVVARLCVYILGRAWERACKL